MKNNDDKVTREYLELVSDITDMSERDLELAASIMLTELVIRKNLHNDGFMKYHDRIRSFITNHDTTRGSVANLQLEFRFDGASDGEPVTFVEIDAKLIRK